MFVVTVAGANDRLAERHHVVIVTTKPLVFEGKQLLINADCPKGLVAVEVVNADGTPIPGFTPEELPDNRYYIFGQEGCKKLAEKLGIPLLGQIPIVQSIRESGDSGAPVALDPEKSPGDAFHLLADTVEEHVRKRNRELEPTKKVEITSK